MSERLSKVAGITPAPPLKPILFWICGSLLALVPLAFSTAVNRSFTLPKFAILIVGSSMILAVLSLIAANQATRQSLAVLKSRYAALVSVYLFAIAISTLRGEVPLASLYGSHENETGLITRLGFFIVFVGLIVAAGRDSKRLLAIVWIMAMVGLIVAAYEVAQFVGRDPFLPSSSYTLSSPAGPVLRVIGTLGHSNYLGNFLLYTTPIAAALAIGAGGRSRRLAFAATALSAAAIVFSGTRGAWFGLLVGAITFAFIELRAGGELRKLTGKRKRVGAAVAAVIVLILVIAIMASPRSRNIVLRARSFASDRFTGSGRILLWRDATRMLPGALLTGCGPDAFSRAFLAYKSRELAVSAATINNESSHNSYLDAAICFGVPGAIAYIAMIACAFLLFARSRRAAPDPKTRLLITGLISSLAAVCVHNFFIYDQIPTGMYFFALMALAVIVSNVTSVESATTVTRDSKQHSTRFLQWVGRGGAVVSVALVAAAIWFSISLTIGDIAIKRAFASAASNDFGGLQTEGERATHCAQPTGAYSFLFARVLSAYLEAHPPGNESRMTSSETLSAQAGRRSWAVENGKTQALKCLAHTFTPESVYVLLAYFALQDGNNTELREYASQAVRWDPNYFNARWLMAEALLAEGDKDGATREARIALALRPGNSEAISVLVRARGDQEALSARVQGLIERARLLRESGNTAKARELLVKAIQASNAHCPSCHRELGLVYEAANQREEAIAEWREFAREAPERAAAEDVAARIETLSGSGAPKH